MAIYVLFGGPIRPSICGGGTIIDCKGWDPLANKHATDTLVKYYVTLFCNSVAVDVPGVHEELASCLHLVKVALHKPSSPEATFRTRNEQL